MLCVPAGLTGHINEALVKVVRLVAAYSDSGFGEVYLTYPNLPSLRRVNQRIPKHPECCGGGRMLGM